MAQTRSSKKKVVDYQEEPRIIDYQPPTKPMDLTPLNALVDKNVIIHLFEERPSRFGQTLVEIKGLIENGSSFTVRTSAKALIDRLKQHQWVFEKGHWLRAKIVKRKSARGTFYYDLAPPEVKT